MFPYTTNKKLLVNNIQLTRSLQVISDPYCVCKSSLSQYEKKRISYKMSEPCENIIFRILWKFKPCFKKKTKPTFKDKNTYKLNKYPF